MGLFKGAGQVTRYKLRGEMQEAELFGMAVAQHCFIDLLETEEMRAGWVNPNDWLDTTAGLLVDDMDPYKFLLLRIDRKRPKPAQLRVQFRKELEAAAEGLAGKQPSRALRKELQEKARLELVKKLVPETTLAEVLIDAATGEVWLGNCTKWVLRRFEDEFVHTFQVGLDWLPLLKSETLQNTEPDWTAWLTWLLMLTDEARGRQPVELGDLGRVVLLIGNRVVLAGELGLEGDRVTVCGNDGEFIEVLTALKAGKLVHEIRLGLLIGGEGFWVTLKVNSPNVVRGVGLPAVAADDGDGHRLERVALISRLLNALEALAGLWTGQRAELDAEVKRWPWAGEELPSVGRLIEAVAEATGAEPATVPTISIDTGKACSNCGEMGAAQNGLCLKCCGEVVVMDAKGMRATVKTAEQLEALEVLRPGLPKRLLELVKAGKLEEAQREIENRYSDTAHRPGV